MNKCLLLTALITLCLISTMSFSETPADPTTQITARNLRNGHIPGRYYSKRFWTTYYNYPGYSYYDPNLEHYFKPYPRVYYYYDPLQAYNGQNQGAIYYYRRR